MPMMTLNRNANCFVGCGTVTFVKGEPTFVPDYMVSAAVSLGAQPSDAKEAKAVEKAIEVSEKLPEPIGSVREQQIKAVLLEIQAVNNPEEFTATGLPSEGAVTARLGYAISKKERETAWKAIIEKAE
jgi:hypothetical protein